MVVSRHVMARIRADLENTTPLPKTSRCKLKPSILCSWLSDLIALLSTLLLELRSEVVVEDDSGAFNEAHIILQINLTIRQLFPEIFIEALRVHAEQAYRKWLRQSTLNRTAYLIQSFELCRKFGWTALYRMKYVNMIHEIIEEKVGNLCSGEYQTEFLPNLQQWLDATILPFAQEILRPLADTSDIDSSNLSAIEEIIIRQNYQPAQPDAKSVSNEAGLKVLLHNSLLHALSMSRAKELFEIVADFPDSVLAIRELREAVNGSSNLPHVGKLHLTQIYI